MTMTMRRMRMTSKEVAERFNVSLMTVLAWARKNSVKHDVAIHGILSYDWSDEDVERFKNRNKKRGRPLK